jgi:hypothetical protein
MLQRTFPAGFIAPCLPTKTDMLPSGDLWLHEIKQALPRGLIEKALALVVVAAPIEAAPT